jgi:anaerobic dimethyl sulfoxide reductase subunit A
MNGKSFIALKAATVPTFSGYDPRISYPAYKGMYDQYGIDKILLAQPMSFGAMPLYPGQHPLLKQDSNGKYIFKDQPLHVPKGMSFVEYLTNLGNKVYAQQGGTGTPSADQAETAVLKWAEELTGVNAATIKNLANAIANAGDVFIENGNNGGQKTNNGMHNVWLTISLSAMCGHVTKLGGNLGVNSSDGMFNPVSFAGGNTYPDLGAANKNKYPFIAVDSNGFVNLVATGRDSRSADEFYMDNLSIYGIDLKDKINPKLEVDMVFGGYHITNSFNTCPNTNKAVNIFTQKKADGTYRIKYYVLYEQFMTPTAAYADVILPACSHHEKPFFTSGEATYYQNKLIDPMYDTKGDVDIDELLAKKLNDLGISVSYTKNGKTDEELLKDAWDTYATVDPSMEKPSFDKVKEMGYVQTSVTDASNPMAGMLPALLYLGVETGKIQFFSPFYFYRDKWDLDLSTFSNPVGPTDCNDPIDFTDTTKVSGKYRVAPKVQYIVPYEGYEQIKDGPKVGVSGRTYSMQFTTKHARNRAHTVYDNVALIKDQFDYPKRATMNPVDAAKRGIREGDKVYIYNDWGCMHVAVTLSERVNQGVVDLPHGVWYRAGNETYIAYYDVDLGNSKGQVQFNGKTYYKYEIPIDIGGSENGLTHDKNANCPRDPWCGQVGNNHFNGNICEISKTKPAN